jgi:hypothetical protein
VELLFWEKAKVKKGQMSLSYLPFFLVYGLYDGKGNTPAVSRARDCSGIRTP